MTKQIIPYYRVSTERQKARGMGLQAQQSAVQAYADRCGGKIAAEFREAESGGDRERPELARAVAAARARGATLVVAKLDRLARDTRLILELVDSGVGIHFCDLPDFGDDPAISRLMLTVVAAIAEFERKRIGQRIKAAIAERKKRGTWKRRPSYFDPQAQARGAKAAAAKRVEKAKKYRALMRPVIESFGPGTLAELAERLNAAGYATPKGKAWTPGTVFGILRE